jgi:hypothetical protein
MMDLVLKETEQEVQEALGPELPVKMLVLWVVCSLDCFVAELTPVSVTTRQDLVEVEQSLRGHATQ